MKDKRKPAALGKLQTGYSCLDSTNSNKPHKNRTNINHHLINAIEEIKKSLIDKVDVIRRDMKTGIMEAYNEEQISALQVECLFQFFKLESD